MIARATGVWVKVDRKTSQKVRHSQPSANLKIGRAEDFNVIIQTVKQLVVSFLIKC